MSSTTKIVSPIGPERQMNDPLKMTCVLKGNYCSTENDLWVLKGELMVLMKMTHGPLKWELMLLMKMTHGP